MQAQERWSDFNTGPPSHPLMASSGPMDAPVISSKQSGQLFCYTLKRRNLANGCFNSQKSFHDRYTPQFLADLFRNKILLNHNLDTILYN